MLTYLRCKYNLKSQYFTYYCKFRLMQLIFVVNVTGGLHQIIEVVMDKKNSKTSLP